MQMRPGLRALKEKIAGLRDWQAEHEALRAAWAEGTEGALRPALVALTDSLGTVRRELDAAVASVEALDRLAVAIEGLGDAPEERERYIGPYNAALRALERRHGEGGPLWMATSSVHERVKPAERAAERIGKLGPERAGAVHFAKSIVVLSSMLGVPHGLTISMAGVLDDLRAPERARNGDGYDPASRVCLRCLRPFESGWRGHRICGDCAPLMGSSLDGEGGACMGVARRLQGL